MEKRYIPILMYHSISSYAGPRFRPWTVPSERFEDHLSYLADCRYTPITVTQLVHARSRGQDALPDRPVVITFDDGYADFYESALPALYRRGFAATLYIATAYVGGTCGWLQREGEASRAMLTWSQVSEIAAAGIECGGHSHTHPRLDAIPATAARDEIVKCKTLLEEHLGQTVSSFAYPHGWHTNAVKRMVRTAGYTSACAVKNMPSSAMDDPFDLARLLVTADMAVADLEALLTCRVFPLAAMLRHTARPIWRYLSRRRPRLRDLIEKCSQHEGRRSVVGRVLPTTESTPS
jgi:peptidoglycan/xylan/chitin deacetylase (PgdA/CDA1 family)